MLVKQAVSKPQPSVNHVQISWNVHSMATYNFIIFYGPTYFLQYMYIPSSILSSGITEVNVTHVLQIS